MSESARHAPAQTRTEPSTEQELRGHIDTNRHELAESVNAASRPNVTAQAGQKMHAATASTGHTLARAVGMVDRAKHKAPAPVQKAVDATGEKLGPLLHQTSEKLAPLLRQGTDKVKAYRTQLLAGGAALIAALFAVRRRKKGDGS